jgi:uncharacterized protein (TIGR03437 family)
MNRMIPTIIRLNARALILAAALIAVAGLALPAQAQVTVVSAASFATDKNVAPNSIASAFGSFNTQNNQIFIANALPLPTTLGGVRVRIGNTDAGLFFVAPGASGQINFLIPGGLADTANATITVTNANNSTSTGTFTIVRSAPGIFSARATGQGTAAAQTTFDGAVFTNTFRADGSENEISAGTRERPNILVLYVTGIRNTPAANPTDGNGVAEAITLRIQGVPATVLFAGPTPGFEGLDQINAIIPPELSGLQSVNIRIRANNRDSNIVTMRIGGQIPAARARDIAFGQTFNEALTVDDQVQAGSSGSTFFFDAYRFSTTTANTPIAVDLRSTAFDAAVLLYRLDGDALSLVAADDESGSYGSAASANNHNAMLMTLIQTPGNYVIFVTSSDFEPNGIGNYSVQLRSVTMTQINYGQTLTGNIEPSDLQNSLGIPYDLFWFNGVQNDRQSILMRSTAFDSFLVLLKNEGDPYLVSDDNGGGGNDSLIDPTHGDDGSINHLPLPRLPQTGVYIIVATPFEANRTGSYTVALNKLAGLGAEPETLSSWDHFFRAPSREIRSVRAGVIEPGKSSLERFGTRRIVR